MFDMIDTRDVFYTVTGLALLGLTLEPAMRHKRWLNLPLFYVLIGVCLASIGVPVLNPQLGGLATKAIEHAAELIVIISLAGAGLAIDTKGTWKNWQPTYRMLAVGMPLTMVGIAVFGNAVLGLSLAGAALLAAALAPTDPVLAQSVQVSPPGRDEKPMEVALTAEAGLNDGLAFPFVYLAIALATYPLAAQGPADWVWDWLGYDVIYRVAVGVIAGILCGKALAWIAHSRLGDAAHGAWNSIVMVLAATMLSYGLTEAFDGYGFLAVFLCARTGRGGGQKDKDRQAYDKFVYHGANQLEAILLAVLLLWLGTFIGAGALAGWTWAEVGFALALILILRPAVGYLALIGYHCDALERRSVAFFGIRGMGSIFYIAYAQNHGPFEQMDVIWRVAALTILFSIVIHGFAANVFLSDEPDEAEDPEHPYKERLRMQD